MDIEKMIVKNINVEISELIEELLSREGCYPELEDIYFCGDSNVFQVFLVNRRFGEQLLECDELVIFDFLGLPSMWFRTCFGQSLTMDYSIQKIWEKYYK